METKALEVSPENKSNTRVLSRYGFAGAFIMSLMVLIAGLFTVNEPEVVATATAAGSLFTLVISPFMVLLGHNKRQETKSQVEIK